MCNLVDASTLSLVAAGSAIGGGLVTGAYQHGRDWFERPVLKLDYAGSDANRVEIERGEAGHRIMESYVRIRVRNIGRRAAKDSLVFLTAISEVNPAGKTIPTSYHDAAPLAWPGSKFSPRNIPRDIDFYADVLRVSKDEPGWTILVERLFGNQQKLRNYSGTYRFQLKAVADNATSANCTIDVTYSQLYDSLRVVTHGI